jgi:protein Mpv17
MGIEGHIWYTYLDRIIARTTWRSVLIKVILDQTIAAPLYTLTYIVGKKKKKDFFNIFCYFLGTSFLEGRKSYRELKKDIRINFLPLYIADCCVSTPVQIINFKYIPSFYRVPFLSFVECIFDAFLSAYKHNHQEVHKPDDKH